MMVDVGGTETGFEIFVKWDVIHAVKPSGSSSEYVFIQYPDSGNCNCHDNHQHAYQLPMRQHYQCLYGHPSTAKTMANPNNQAEMTPDDNDSIAPLPSESSCSVKRQV